MLWPFVIAAVFIVVILGVLLVQPERWDERWVTLAAGSWISDLMDEEENQKLPVGNYVISWPRIEWR